MSTKLTDQKTGQTFSSPDNITLVNGIVTVPDVENASECTIGDSFTINDSNGREYTMNLTAVSGSTLSFQAPPTA